MDKPDARIKLSISGQAFFQSRDSNQHKADASLIEDRANLLKTGHFEAIGFIHYDKLRGIADALLLRYVFRRNFGIRWP
jgi:hypothetical protein